MTNYATDGAGNSSKVTLNATVKDINWTKLSFINK